MRRFATIAILACSLAALSFGCDRDTYVIVHAGDGGGSSVDVLAKMDGCVVTNKGIEICDYLDNDCDGKRDEGFNLQTNVDHCGKCNNSCKMPGMLTKCELGKCKTMGCAPGYHDLNGYAKDGCEYKCNPTGKEICDLKDNDCNGKIDDTINTDNDVNNCGKCGNKCTYLNGVGKCVKGVCQLLKCSKCYVNLDQKEANGCEWPCCFSNGSVEKCDGVDNDCNGVIDDLGGKKIDHKTNPAHCGGCNISCSIPNSATECKAGKCVFKNCKTGFVDADKDPTNGCECKYVGKEKCNGVDDDCNGKPDDGMKQYPGICGKATPPCKQGVLSCQNGIETCTGKLGPWPELCDGKDQDCDGKKDPTNCLNTGKKRERRLDQPNVSTLGAYNSAQLHVAGGGNHMIAVWQDRRNNKADIYASYSKNGGLTWANPDVGVATEIRQKLEPKVALGYGQRAYVAYTRFSGQGSTSSAAGPRYVYLRRTTNGGANWGSAVTVSTGSSSGDALWLSLAVIKNKTADTVVICWEEMVIVSPINPTNRIRCNISFNSGQSFASSSTVASGTAKDAIVPSMALDNKYVYLTWQQGTEINVSRAPLGTSFYFSSLTKVSKAAGRKPKIAADTLGRVVVVWEDISGKLIDLYASASTNYGASWGAAARVDKDAPLVNGDSTNPMIVYRPGGKVMVVWEDTNRGKRDIYFNVSDTFGKTWGAAAVRVNANTAGAAKSLHPHIAVELWSKRVFVTWEDYRNGSHGDVYFNFSLNNGKTWNVPDYRVDESTPAGGANARAPMMWVSPQRVGVVWIDNRSGFTGAHKTGANADIYSSWVK